MEFEKLIRKLFQNEYISMNIRKIRQHEIIVLLQCQWKYWHRAKNRLQDKTGFGMYNPQNVEKSGFGRSVCVSVCLAVCLSCCRFSRELSQA